MLVTEHWDPVDFTTFNISMCVYMSVSIYIYMRNICAHIYTHIKPNKAISGLNDI